MISKRRQLIGIRQNMVRRNGYVLILVLVLLVIMATVLSKMASRTMRTTQEVGILATQLQQRIGTASCQEALLERSFLVFKTLDRRRQEGTLAPTPEANWMVSDSVELGGLRFDLVMSDESSKINLNSIYYFSGPEEVYKTLQNSLSVDFVQAINLRPAVNANRAPKLDSPGAEGAPRSVNKPSSRGTNATGGSSGDISDQLTSNDGMKPAFRSWGEVLDFGKLVSISPTGQVPLDFTKSFTLWGRGPINVIRASDTSVLKQMESVVPSAKAQKILGRIRDFRDFNVQSILELEESNARLRQQLRTLIGQESYAFSLFVDADAPQARSRKLFTLSPDENGTIETQEFVFH